jgi:hypothetical protein
MRICFDACFMIALYDETDGEHQRAVDCFDLFIEKRRMNSVLLPWPVMYEAVSTRMARVSGRMEKIDRDLRLLRTRGALHLTIKTSVNALWTYASPALRNAPSV